MEKTKKELADSPSRDDVHEQREKSQPREGVVGRPGNGTTSDASPGQGSHEKEPTVSPTKK